MNCKRIVFSLLFSLFFYSGFAQAQYIGPDETSHIFEDAQEEVKNFIDSSYTPHIAYVGLKNNKRVIVVKKYNAGVWTDLTTDSLYLYSEDVVSFDIGVSPSGVINLLFVRNTIGHDFFLFAFQNNTWVKNKSNFNDNIIPARISLAFNNSETPIIVYINSGGVGYRINLVSIIDNQWITFASEEIDESPRSNLELLFSESIIYISWLSWDHRLMIRRINFDGWDWNWHTINVNFPEFIYRVKIFECKGKTVIAALTDNNIYILTDSITGSTFEVYKNINLGYRVYDIQMNSNEDYCVMYNKGNYIVFSSNNSSYMWKDKKIIFNICPFVTPPTLRMTNDFAPYLVVHNKLLIQKEQLIDLNKSVISTLPGNKVVVKKNALGELFLVLITNSDCPGNTVESIEAYKWDGSIWRPLGDLIDSVYAYSELFVEINPSTQQPIVAFNNIDNLARVYVFENQKWKRSKYQIEETFAKRIKSLIFSPFEELFVLFEDKTCYRFFSNGQGVDMNSSGISNKISITDNSRLFIDPLNNLYIVGHEKSSENYKTLKYINSDWQELPSIPVENLSLGNYDLAFDEFNRPNLLFRYRSNGIKTGIWRYSPNTNSWEEPYGGYQANSILNTLNLMFIDNKPYVAYLSTSTSIKNIRLLSYTNNTWDDAITSDINRYTAKDISVFNDKHNIYIAFNGWYNVVASIDLKALGIRERKIKNENYFSPNPAHQTIQFNHSVQIKNVKFYNTLGQLVLEKNQMGKEENVDISVLNDGVYIVEFISNTGDSFTQRLIVRK